MLRGITIGHLARRTGLTAQGIRYYEQQGLLPKPERTHTGYRIYGTEAVQRLSFIKQARRLGLSLEDIKRILKMSVAGRAPCCQVRELLAGKLEQLDHSITELTKFRDGLKRFLAKIAGMPDQADASRQVCTLIEISPSLPPLASGPPFTGRGPANSRPRRSPQRKGTAAQASGVVEDP